MSQHDRSLKHVVPGSGRVVAAGIALTLSFSILLMAAPVARAQTDGPPVGSAVRVAHTEGQRLNLRAGPATDQPILARLPAGETLTVTGAARTLGATRWLPVRTAAGQEGWVSTEFVVLLAPGAPAPQPVAESAPQSSPGSVGSTRGPAEQTTHDSRAEPKGGSVEVEAKLKYPEVKGRDQEITVWVTRNGAPVPGAIVTLESSDGDDGERFRELDPTDAEGRTRRTFDVRLEKGTVELQVEAVAPDGGEGRSIVSYFRR